MPSKTTLTINDRTDDLAFNPDRTDQNGVTHFVHSDGVPFGDKRLSFSSRTTGERIRLEARFAVPVVVTETINGVDRETLERSTYVKVNFDFDRRSNAIERNAAIGLLHSLLHAGQTEASAFFKDLENWY